MLKSRFLLDFRPLMATYIMQVNLMRLALIGVSLEQTATYSHRLLLLRLSVQRDSPTNQSVTNEADSHYNVRDDERILQF